MSQLPNGWELKKLGEECVVIMGQSPVGSSYNDTGEGVPLINGPVEFGGIDPFSYTVATKFTTKPTKMCKKGDLILCVRGSTTGRMNIAGQDACVGRGVAAIRSSKNQDWINLIISYYRQKIFAMGSGSTFPNVSATVLNNIIIPFPPLPEQKRIVSILDEAFEGIDQAIANTEKNIANARELVENYLTSVFTYKGEGWEQTTIGNLCKKVEYGSSSKSNVSGKIPVLRMGNIQSGKFDWNDLVYTDNDEEIYKYLLRYNDVLFNRTNSAELVGKTAIYKGEQPAIFAGYLIRLHRKEDLIDADFLNYYLNSSPAKEYGNITMSKSINQANINGTKLKQYPISVPKLSMQVEIVKRISMLQDETHSLLSTYQQKLNSLKELKQSILQKAFSGRLN